MLILNEKKYVEKLLAEHCYEKNPYFDLRLIAIYMRTYDCMEDAEIYDFLINELKKYMPFEYLKREAKWHSICNKFAATTKDCRLVEIDSVPITSKEIETIKAIDDFRVERLAFTMLVMAKFNHMANPQNSGWVNYDDKTIFDSANVRCRTDDRDMMFCKLVNLGLIETPKKNTLSNERVLFIDDSNEDVVLEITDPRRLGMQYQDFIGDGKFIRCEKCGLIVKDGKRRPKKYCADCYKESNLENARERKNRMKQVSY